MRFVKKFRKRRGIIGWLIYCVEVLNITRILANASITNERRPPARVLLPWRACRSRWPIGDDDGLWSDAADGLAGLRMRATSRVFRCIRSFRWYSRVAGNRW